jgi:hypothetical protein
LGWKLEIAFLDDFVFLQAEGVFLFSFLEVIKVLSIPISRISLASIWRGLNIAFCKTGSYFVGDKLLLAFLKYSLNMHFHLIMTFIIESYFFSAEDVVLESASRNSKCTT